VSPTDKSKTGYGVVFGLAAYGLWGLIPLYFKAMAEVAPLELLAHRALWSFALLAVLVRLLGRWGELWKELRSGKLMLMLGFSTVLIAANWLIFIYAVVSSQVLQASLGYFITPLVNVLLGIVFLREHLRPFQVLSIAVAAVGVLVLAVLVGEIPWIALSLALTFSFYSLMRKVMPVDGLVSLTVETLAMTPAALAYIGYLGMASKTTCGGVSILGLLMLSGPVTTIPLLFFGAAAHRLRLSTMGVLQYLSPSLQFLVAVAAFREPFSAVQLLSFALIWTAIGIYTTDSFRAMRHAQLDLVEPFGADP
jgi:chloramphenicol-sensitive protein RarD